MKNCPPGFVLSHAEDSNGGLTCRCDNGDKGILACNLTEQSVELKVAQNDKCIHCIYTFVTHRMACLQ